VLVEDLAIPGVGLGLLRLPDLNVRLRGGIVALHGASRSERSQPLFDHLAQTLVPLGYAVLSYDRRAKVNSSDVPLADQAADAREALAMLKAHLDAPVGLFAFSQGAWAACVAAAIDTGQSERSLVSFLALLGCSGVSPAAQMQFFTDELLRRSGYDAEARARARELRLGLEETVRGKVDPAATSAALAAASQEPWFDLTYLPSQMPPPDESWDDMDFDPAADIAQVTCPTLLIYGADEECVPAPESESVWRSTGHRDLTVAYLPRCGHFPVVDGAGQPEPNDPASLSPDYTAALKAWFTPQR
jgi:uncharacterized protein